MVAMLDLFKRKVYISVCYTGIMTKIIKVGSGLFIGKVKYLRGQCIKTQNPSNGINTFHHIGVF